MTQLKDRLRQAREAKRLSQSALAKLAKCGQTTIASIENGRNKGSKILPRLAALLDVDVYWLTEGKEPGKINEPRSIQKQEELPGVPDPILADLAALDPEDADVWRAQIRAAAIKARRKQKERNQERVHRPADPPLERRRTT